MVALKNYISINRNLFNHDLWLEKRKFSRFEAWMDIIRTASFKDGQKGNWGFGYMKWGRAQMPVSITFLSQRWQWTPMKVRGFIKYLINNDMIMKNTEKLTTGGTTYHATTLTVCNYDRYNVEQQGVQQGVQQVLTSKYNKDSIKKAQILYDSFKEDARSDEYSGFVDWLFGKSEDELVYDYCLSLPDAPVDYTKYKKLRTEYSKTEIVKVIQDLQNKRPPKYKSFYLVVNNWCKQNKKGWNK